MDVGQILLGLLLGSFTLLMLGWIMLIDWMGFIAWWGGVIMPRKNVEEFVQHKKLRKNQHYGKNIKQHNRKWRLRFLIPIPVYAGVYLLFAHLPLNPLLAFFVAVWPSVIVLDRLATKEAKERKHITEIYMDKKSEDKS